MSKIADKKFTALKEILNNYNLYKGEFQSPLEKEIERLNENDKLTKEEYERLINAFVKYKDYLLKVISNTRKVFIKIDNQPIDIDNLFEDLEE